MDTRIENLRGKELTERAGAILGMMETVVNEGIAALAKGGAREVEFDKEVPVFNENYAACGFTVNPYGVVWVLFKTHLSPMRLNTLDAPDALDLLWHIMEYYHKKGNKER